MDEDLVKKIKLYLKRSKQDSLVENHPLEEGGYWRIIEGWDRMPMKDIVHGKFIDAVAYAVQQSEFYANWTSNEDPSNCNNGKVEKVQIRDLESQSLVNLVKTYKVDRKNLRQNK